MAMVRYKGKLLKEEDFRRLYPGAIPDAGSHMMGDTDAAYQSMGGNTWSSLANLNTPTNYGAQGTLIDQYRNEGLPSFPAMDTSRFDKYGHGTYKGDASKYVPPDDAGKGWFNAENMNAFGAAAGGLGSLAKGWAAMKNLKLARQSLENQQNQWQTDYESQRLTTNNAIANQNAWKKAQGRTDFGAYVGGKPAGTNYVG